MWDWLMLPAHLVGLVLFVERLSNQSLTSQPPTFTTAAPARSAAPPLVLLNLGWADVGSEPDRSERVSPATGLLGRYLWRPRPGRSLDPDEVDRCPRRSGQRDLAGHGCSSVGLRTAPRAAAWSAVGGPVWATMIISRRAPAP